MRVHICSFVDTVAEVSDGRRKYRFEFSEMFGPTLIDARGNVLKNQPVRETHPFWRPFNQWLQEYRAKQAVKP
jgi:hypothetical protein